MTLRNEAAQRPLSQPNVLRALQRLQPQGLVRTMPKHSGTSLVWQVLSHAQVVDGPSASCRAGASS